MARVLAWIPDLLFGSNVLGALQAAGHEVELVSAPPPSHDGRDVLIIDLTADAPERLQALSGAIGSGVRTLAFYSHVEADVRAQALAAGIEMVVPRSRMAREGPALLARLLGAA